MKITRLTTPTFAAVTNEEIAEWLRIDPATDVATLAMLLGSATDMVESLTGLAVGAATYRINFFDARKVYHLPITPLVSVTSVTLRGDAEPLDPSKWALHGDCVVLTDYPAVPASIVLEAGFGSPETIPDGIRHAIAVMVGASYDGRHEMSDQTAKTVDRLVSRWKRVVL
jgi:uncharacterized phiE125 gp8 family phage protein